MSGCSSKYNGYMSADTAARCEELDQHIAFSLMEIDENSELLRELKRLSHEKLEQILSQCEQLEGDKRHDYLQEELNVTFNMRSQNVRNRELADVLFHYLLKNEKPVRKVQHLVRRIYDKGYISTDSWYADCCFMLIGYSGVLFTQLFKRLGNNPYHLEYLLYKQPQLLLNKYSHHLIVPLNKHLPHDNLHQILQNTRDENGQTCMFFIVDWPTELYKIKFDDLCELMSVRNSTGQTVFHANTTIALKALCANVTLDNQDKVNELLSIIRDNNNKTVYDTARDIRELDWLKKQLEHNNYPLFNRIQFLILYNTNYRPEAEKEAETIQRAFQSVTEPHLVIMDKMGTKQEVLQLIKSTASDYGISSLIVCVMSHGNSGTIDDSEGNPITIASIEREMCSDVLRERPKILITQSCQTRYEWRGRTHEVATCSNTDPGRSPSALVSYSPYEPGFADFLSVQCCVSGQMSVRNVFIPYLAEQIESSSTTDTFPNLLLIVSHRMWRAGNEQTPITKSTLRGRVCIKDGYRSVVDEIPNSVGEQTSELQHGSSEAAAEPATANNLEVELVFRRSSFEGWRFEHVQKAEDLVQAGFYYPGFRDVVNCLSCDLSYGNWTSDENPVKRHLKFKNPNCPFAREVPNERSVLHEQVVQIEPIPNQHQRLGINEVNIPAPVETLHQEPPIKRRKTEVSTVEKASLSTTSSSIGGENPNSGEEQTSEIENQASTAARDPIKESRYGKIDLPLNLVSLFHAMISTSDTEKFMIHLNCLKKLECDQIFDVLNLQFTNGETITHRAAEMNCLEFFEFLSQRFLAVSGESTSTEQRNLERKRLQLMNNKTHYEETAAHYAFRKGNVKIIDKICSLISNTDFCLLTLLSHQSTSDSTLRSGTCLHTAVSNRNSETIRWIIKHIKTFQESEDKKFPEKSYRDLLNARNKHGSTIWQLDLCREMQFILDPEFDSFYSPPLLHGKSEKRALVFYNTLRREGASAEMEQVRKSLKRLGCDVKIEHDFSEGTMLKAIEEDVAQHKDRCCIYFVFVMAHGDEGQIKGADDNWFEIVKILRKMEGLNTLTPKALFIQACRGKKRPTDVNVPNVDMSTPATQPHLPNDKFHLTGLNTTVYFATLYNHAAYRNCFITYLSEEFDKVGEDEQSLDDIMLRVRYKMSRTPNYVFDNLGSPDKIAQIGVTLETRTKKVLIRTTKIRKEEEDDAASSDPKSPHLAMGEREVLPN